MEKDFQRWTAKRKIELPLQLIRGETKLVDACREHDLKQSEVEGWMDAFLPSGGRGLKARSEDEQAAHERELRELRAKVGELVLEPDREAQRLAGAPAAPGPSPTRPRLGVAGDASESALGDRYDASLHAAGRLVPPHRDHRLL
jgi:transposase-like protein